MSTPQDNPDGQGWNAPGSGDGQQNPYGRPGQGSFGQGDQEQGGQTAQGGYGYHAAPTPGYAYPTQGGDMAQAGKGPAPTEVMRAYYLILAAGALYLVSTIISSLVTEVPQVAGASFGIVLGIVLAVIAAGIYVLLAVFIRKGQNWARITATVLAALNVLSTLSSFLLLPLAEQAAEAAGQPIPETPGLILALSVLVMLLGVAGVVMTYLKPARPYFAARQLGY